MKFSELFRRGKCSFAAVPHRIYGLAKSEGLEMRALLVAFQTFTHDNLFVRC